MLGMPGRRVNRFLQVQPGVDVAQKELRDPLILLVAARRAPGEIRLAVAPRPGRRERGGCRGAGKGGGLPSTKTTGARLRSKKPSSGMTGEDCSQPPDGVDDTMLPAWSMISKCTVSPRGPPSRPTAGSPAP